MDAPCYIYGRHPVLEALTGDPKGLRILYVQQKDGVSGRSFDRGNPDGEPHAIARAQRLAQELGLDVREVRRQQLERLLGSNVVHQGLVLETAPFAYTELQNLRAPAGETPLFIVLDQLQDPRNVGAIVRSGLALGAHGLILGKDRSADISHAAIKASAGATAHLPIARVTNISRTLTALKSRGLWIVGTDTNPRSVPLKTVDLTLPTALVVGHEGSGMRALTARHCDVLAHIPMNNIGSLNVSTALAIAVYEAQCQRMAARAAGGKA